MASMSLVEESKSKNEEGRGQREHSFICLCVSTMLQETMMEILYDNNHDNEVATTTITKEEKGNEPIE